MAFMTGWHIRRIFNDGITSCGGRDRPEINDTQWRDH
jgi:hypothetical protein